MVGVSDHVSTILGFMEPFSEGDWIPTGCLRIWTTNPGHPKYHLTFGLRAGDLSSIFLGPNTTYSRGVWMSWEKTKNSRKLLAGDEQVSKGWPYSPLNDQQMRTHFGGWFAPSRLTCFIPSLKLPEHLQHWGWKMSFLLGRPIFRG